MCPSLHRWQDHRCFILPPKVKRSFFSYSLLLPTLRWRHRIKGKKRARASDATETHRRDPENKFGQWLGNVKGDEV